ncbi:hypothetical protein ASC61_01920 [Aeromicrobium sp. Root344]|nr:hypothetical protein ASC61_01920 [Aeromicrobium sp. Root344]
MQPDNWEDLLRKINPSPEMTHMVTDNTLVKDIDHDGGASRATLWQHEERASAYDMECGGFGREMQHESGLAWAVVRSVSDFGFDKSNAESGMRTASALLAATFIREFIASGISKSHPRALRPAQTTSPKLSPQQHYSQHSASDYFANRLSDEFGFSLPVSLLSRELSLGDVAIHLSAQGLDRDEANRFLEVLRVEYFESKYLEYDYSLDIRGYFGDYWYQEIREMLAWYGYENLVGRSLLDVGCGNGLEIGPLVEVCSPSDVTGVDLSRQMLARARERHPEMTTIACSADALNGIESDSVDAYMSLRTYMSRFFDVPAALREAYRVLKPGGLLLISIANGYLDYSADGAPHVVTGLKEVGGSSFVSADRPFELLTRYHRQIRSLGFERLHVLSKLTDVYIGALKPGASDARRTDSPGWSNNGLSVEH